MATERVTKNTNSQPDSFRTQYYTEVARAYDTRAPQLENEWEQPAMRTYRRAALQILSTHLFQPESATRNSISILEYGAGVGKITRELIRTNRFFSDPQRTIEITPIDVSGVSLSIYCNKVPDSTRVKINPIVSNAKDAMQSFIDLNTLIEKGMVSGKKKIEFDNIYANGVYQMSPDDMLSVLGRSLSCLKKHGSLIFDFLPLQGGEVSAVDSPRGSYKTYFYSQETIGQLIHQAADVIGEAYTFEFKKLSELIDEKTKRPFGLLVVPNIEKGSGEKQIDPVFCIIKKEERAGQEKEQFEATYEKYASQTDFSLGNRYQKTPYEDIEAKKNGDFFQQDVLIAESVLKKKMQRDLSPLVIEGLATYMVHIDRNIDSSALLRSYFSHHPDPQSYAKQLFTLDSIFSPIPALNAIGESVVGAAFFQYLVSVFGKEKVFKTVHAMEKGGEKSVIIKLILSRFSSIYSFELNWQTAIVGSLSGKKENKPGIFRLVSWIWERIKKFFTV